MDIGFYIVICGNLVLIVVLLAKILDELQKRPL